MWELAFLLLPVAAYTGWVAGRRSRVGHAKGPALSPDYYAGLNYLINEQPDKAVDAFTRMLDMNPEAVETSLALGSLFRRQGEVDRAIRIHQELIARPTLSRKQKGLSLLELGEDYMYAGVYDRAESLFYELSHSGGEASEKSQKHLIGIYEREKDWDKAIETAKSYQSTAMAYMGRQIAHYYCEKAVLAEAQGDVNSAYKYLKRSTSHDKHCVRASIILGEIELNHGKYKAALSALKRVEQQDPRFISEVLSRIIHIHNILGLESALDNYLSHVLRTTPVVSVILAYAKQLERQYGPDKAVRFMGEYLQQYPSVVGLQHLIQFHLKRAHGASKEDMSVLQALIERILANRALYQCERCGFALKNLHWQCPSCKQWSTVVPKDNMLLQEL